MKKIIYIVCGIFIFGLVIENTNFMYAEDEETLLIEDNAIKGNEIEDNKLIFGEDTDNFINEYQNEELIESEKSNSINEIMVENDMNGLANIEEIQTFEMPQVTQTIDTSDYGIIRIKDPNNTGMGITMLDRNLGATATGAGVDDSIESYGYYYQWGNNYGFPTTGDIEKSTTIPLDASSYGPGTASGYYSSDTFIKGHSDWSTISNNNLRGGSGDSRNGNGGGYPVINASERKGPCPENYHIPSAGEWSKVLDFWASTYTGSLNLSTDSSTNLKSFENNLTALDNFYSTFYIPVAGRRGYRNSNIEELQIQGLLQSSSPKDSTSIFTLFGENSNLFSYGYTNNRANAIPIRCFYNSYRLPVIITYNLSGGYWTDDVSTESKVITYTKNDDSDFSGDIILGTIKRDANCGENENKKCMFGGRYTLTGDEMWIGNISEDITLYAKWFAYDDKDISLSGVNFTIMDRNLGAENSGTGGYAYGYYLTGGETDILCPEGYHIPKTGELEGIQELLGSDFNSDLVKNLLDLPFAGKMLNNGDIEDEGNGYYLANNGTEMMYAKISNSGIDIASLNEGDKVSVRCFKDYNTGTIKFDSNGGSEINDINAVDWWEDGEKLEEPRRGHSIFLGWYTTSDFQEGTKLGRNINYKNEEEILLYAKWECEQGYQENGDKCEKIPQKSGGSSGGGGGGGKNIISNVYPAIGNNEKSTEDQTGSSPADLNPSVTVGQLPLKEELNEIEQGIPHFQRGMSEGQGDYPQEFIDAYNFAYKNGITTKKSIYDAKMYSPLTRIQMAKMLSNYTINVLGKEPDISKGIIKFSDVPDKLNKEYDNAVTLAYQLGIMGQNIKSGKFRPYDEVTRAEFATALSRLLYSTEDGKGSVKYYEPHITKLYNEGIMNKVNPIMGEKRGYIIIMLMRSSK